MPQAHGDEERIARGGLGAPTPSRRLGAAALLAASLALATPGSPRAEDASARAISAIGRIEPGEGAIHVAGPSGAAPVIAELRVEEGDRVERGQTLAILDTHALRQAEALRLEAELENAERELRRVEQLQARSSASRSELDAANVAARVARASDRKSVV